MADLPYKVEINSADLNKFTQAVNWCRQQWPYTRGATWYTGVGEYKMVFGHPAGYRYSMVFGFQRREDAVSFELAWA
jgi:hypothetical protein